MGLFQKVFPKKDKRTLDVNTGRGLIETLRGHGVSPSAGVNITEMTAMRATAVFACVRIIAESIATLPCLTYKRNGEDKDRFPDHYLYELLRYEPNPEMTAFSYWETLARYLATWGNAHAEIMINGKGEVTGLYPILPYKVTMQRNQMTQEIEYRVQGVDQPIPAWKMFHVPFFPLNGRMGISPIGYARLAVGLSVAAEEYGAAFYENGATPSIVLTYPGELSPEAITRLKAGWNDENQGPGNAHKTQVLEEGMTVNKLSIPPNDAQFLETRRFQVEEIARIYRIPPHMLADLEKATFSNIEHQDLAFVKHTLQPWLVRFEQEIRRKLLFPNEKRLVFSEFLVDGMLRGDVTSRYNAYHIARQDGWMSANDIRKKENMNLIENGNAYWQPLNMIEAGSSSYSDDENTRSSVTSAHPVEQRVKDNAVAARRQDTLSWRPIIKDAAERILKKESADLKKIVKQSFNDRDADDFVTEIEQYYAERFESFAMDRMNGVFQGYGSAIALHAAQETGQEVNDVIEEGYLERFIYRYSQAYISRHIAESKEKLNKAINRGQAEEEAGLENGTQEVLNEELDNWEDRASSISKDEGTQLNGAVARKVFALAGVLFLAWKTYGDTCPYCREMDGVQVGISDNFLTAGISLVVDDEDTPPFIPQKNKKHPPLHGGCDCGIVAVL